MTLLPDSDDPTPSASVTAHALVTLSRHSMVTRMQDGIRKVKVKASLFTTRYPLPSALAAVLSSSQSEPTCFSTAVKFPERRSALTEEFNALLKNQT